MENREIKAGSYYFNLKKIELSKSDSYYDLCKDLYYYEKNRKTQFNSETISYLSILTLIYVCFIFFIQNLTVFVNYEDGINKGYEFNLSLVLFLLFFIFSFIFSSWSLYFFRKSLYGHKYANLPELDEISTYIEHVKKNFLTQDKDYYEENYSYEEVEELFNIHIKNIINDSYKKCASNDNKKNDEKVNSKIKYLDKLIISAFLTFLTAIPFFYKYNTTDPSIQFIDIVDKKNLFHKDFKTQDLEKKYYDTLNKYTKLKIEYDKINITKIKNNRK